MKKLKKLLSLLTVLSMVAIMFSAIPVQVSAAGGDVFNVNAVPDGWRYYTSSYVTRGSNGSLFTLGASTNKGNGLDNYGIMAANGLSTEVVRASTAYRIKFRVETWFNLTQLEVNIDTGTALWSRTNSVQRFTDLSSRSSNSSGGGGSKLYTDLTFDVVTPSTITGNQHFVIGIIPQSGNVGSTANLKFYNITITELMTVDVVNSDTSASVGTVYCLPGDDVETLLTNGGFSVAGYSMVADIDTIAADTETITVTYTINPHNVQEIDFSDSYAGGSPNWRYIPNTADSFELDGTGIRHIELTDERIHHDRNKSKPTGSDIGQHSVTLANSYTNSGLEAGGTYRVTFNLTTFPHWTPVESLGAYIRFGQDIWTNVIDSATISLTGEDLAAAITSNTPTGTGSVVFTISLDVTLPESGWANSYRNIILAVYGGEYWLDNVAVSTTARFDVQDESSNHLGYAYGLLGDRTAKIVNGESFVDAYHTFTLSPATVTAYNDVITLTKSLKSNIVDIIDFTTTDYPGNTEAGTGNYYSKDETNKKMIYTGSALKGNGVNVGNTFGFRSFVVSNNRADSGLEAGGTYRVALKFSSWYQPSTFGLQVGFGNSVWSADMNSYRQTYTGDALLGKLVTERALSGTQSGIYTLNIDVTLPEAAAWDGYTTNKNVIVSLYGIGSNNIEYFLSKAYIYSSSRITLNSYDGTVNATATGFAGDTITEVYDSANNAKLTNFSETFGAADKTVSAGNYKTIKRGDSDGNGMVNSRDVIRLRTYLLYGSTVDFDAFGANADAVTFADNVINIKDLVRTKTILITPAAPTEPIAGLAKTGYKLAWSYEFNDSAVDSDYFGVQYGMAHSSSSSDVVDSYNYVGTSDKKCSYVKDGALVISPDGNYGSGNPFICEPYMTKDKMHFTYGYLEINAKIPFGSGSFPALWLKSEKDASNNVWEIDLVETLGSTNNIAVNLHYWDGGTTDHNANGVSGRNYNLGATINEFHKFGFEWYKEGGVSYIAFYVDGNHVKTLSKDNIGYNADFDKEMYLMLENFPITSEFLSANSSWLSNANAATVSDYPMDMCIDYVRLYQTESNSGNTLDTFD